MIPNVTQASWRISRVKHKLCPRSQQQNHIAKMLPLVQWQKISFAQAAALTWSISRFSFLGRGERDLIQKCLGMAYIGCSRWFKRGAEFGSISNCVCGKSLWFFLCLAVHFRGTWHSVFCSLHPSLIPLKPCFFCSWPRLLRFLHPFSTFAAPFVPTPLFLYLYSLSSPLSLPLSLHLSFTHYHFQLSLCFLSYLPSPVALYSQWTGPMDSKWGVWVCVCVWKSEREEGKKIG